VVKRTGVGRHRPASRRNSPATARSIGQEQDQQLVHAVDRQIVFDRGDRQAGGELGIDAVDGGLLGHATDPERDGLIIGVEGAGEVGRLMLANAWVSCANAVGQRTESRAGGHGEGQSPDSMQATLCR